MENVATVFLTDIEVHMSLEGLVDVEKEKASLLKEKENLEKFIAGIETKLGNAQFVERAPAALIVELRANLSEAKEKVEKIEGRLGAL